jgi:hypothetical protein
MNDEGNDEVLGGQKHDGKRKLKTKWTSLELQNLEILN